MLSSIAPSKKGSASLTLRRRASSPSVLSMMSDASISHSAFTASPWNAATSIRSASTAPLAVYRCTATARSLNQGGYASRKLSSVPNSSIDPSVPLPLSSAQVLIIIPAQVASAPADRAKKYLEGGPRILRQKTVSTQE